MRKFIPIRIALFFIKSLSYAGCLSAGNNIYFNSSGNYNGQPYYNWNGTTSDANRINNGGTPMCVNSYNPKRSCYIRYNCSIFGCSYDLGEEVTYCPLPCPFDDYIPILLLALASLGVFALKEKATFRLKLS